ncbi:serine protease [Candidatus Uhrbacteria bacterium]|nr:serine protease [Candidatus Uhrbacteria bacterium]
MKLLSTPVSKTLETLLLAVAAGAASGAITALVVTPGRQIVREIPTATSTPPVATSTAPVEPPLVRLEPQLSKPLLPPTFVARRASPVFTVYRKPRGTTPEERTLTEDRALGQAVALTSDGWLVTASPVVGSLRVADLAVWVNDKSVRVERAIADSLNGTTYLKVGVSELTSPAFGQVSDLAAGSEAWVERRASAFEPSLVLSLRANIPSTDAGSSEAAFRRILVGGTTQTGDRGMPVWNAKGALIGIVESAAGEPIRAIPATSIADSFAGLLQQNAITHALLGVQSLDLQAWRVDGDRGRLPARGALLKDNRKQNRPAVAKDSPAAIAGLKAGDVIVRVERDILDGSSDLGEILSEYRPRSVVTLRVWRDGEETDVPVTLGAITTSAPLK